MGDVGSAIATPFVAVGATVTGNANKKIYYNCPRCGDEVWVYGAGAAFVGNKCVDCRGKSGPVDLGIIGDAIDAAVTTVTAPVAIVTGQANDKIWYNCPKCGERKWISAMAPHLKGRPCLDCKPFLLPQALVSVSKIDTTVTAKIFTSNDICGSRVYKQWGSDSDSDYSHLVNLNDAISWYETRSCRILHGSYSWLANGISQTATFGQVDLIDHWWVTIKTKKECYYQLQFRSDGAMVQNDNALIELRKCASSNECDQNGLAEAVKASDSHIFKNSSYSSSSSNYTIGDVVKWMKSHSFSAKWHVRTHNCQDLCKTFNGKF